MRAGFRLEALMIAARAPRRFRLCRSSSAYGAFAGIAAATPCTRVHSTRTADIALGAESFTLAGSSQPHPNLPPYLVLNVIIALIGEFPPRN